MKGQENSEDRFEQEWRDALDDAQQTPPEGVWDNIDRELTYQELARYKSRLVYYRWAAAAMLLIALSLGTMQYFYYDLNQMVVAEQTKRTHEPGSDDQPMQAEEAHRSERLPIATVMPDSPSVVDSDMGATELKDAAHQNTTSSQKADGEGKAGSKTRIEERMLVSEMPAEAEEKGAELPFSGEEYPVEGVVVIHTTLYDTRELQALRPDTDLPQTQLEKTLYRLPFYPGFQKKHHDGLEDKRYWAGVNVGSGGFDPNYESASTTLLSESINTQSNVYSNVANEALTNTSPNLREGMSAGQTVSLGLNFGMKLSDRWVLESGVQYARADATTQTNMVIETSTLQEVIPATNQGKAVPQYASVVASEEVIEYEYRDVDMNNQFEFAALPVKAGYLVFNSKFSMEVNAGVITNIYLGNKLTDSDDDVAGLTIGPGSSSPYRTVSFSGLAGIEFGYRFLKNFDFVIEPNYRRSINSLTKESADFNTSPSGFGLTTGIRFIFD